MNLYPAGLTFDGKCAVCLGTGSSSCSDGYCTDSTCQTCICPAGMKIRATWPNPGVPPERMAAAGLVPKTVSALPARCECGAAKVGGRHSSWCPMIASPVVTP